MNTFVLYIQDDPHNPGCVKISAEIIGEPETSLQIGESVLLSMLMHDTVTLDTSPIYTKSPTTNHVQ